MMIFFWLIHIFDEVDASQKMLENDLISVHDEMRIIVRFIDFPQKGQLVLFNIKVRFLYNFKIVYL